MISLRKNQEWIPSVFNDFFDNDWMNRGSLATPAINVLEKDKSYELELAAPGLTKKDFCVQIDANNNLVIQMEKQSSKEEKDPKDNLKYLRKEFSYSNFEQTLLLPDNVDKKGIKAIVENGMLKISLPKLNNNQQEESKQIIEIQ